MYFYDTLQTPVGTVTLVLGDNGLKQVVFGIEKKKKKFNDSLIKDAFKLKEIREQFLAYFNKELSQFKIKLDPDGTAFQKKVWRQLLEIPYGEARTYQDIADVIGNPQACRAVGLANSLNPLPIVVPCHRVIGKNGKLTGYAGGLGIKSKLLELENIQLHSRQYRLF